MNHWERHDMLARLLVILQEAEARRNPNHHFGQPFVDAYDLAVAFSNRHEAAFRAIGLPIGGQGTGERRSLAPTEHIA